MIVVDSVTMVTDAQRFLAPGTALAVAEDVRLELMPGALTALLRRSRVGRSLLPAPRGSRTG